MREVPFSASFRSGRAVRLAALTALLLAGIGIRLYDLTDPPLDFHETRQLGSAIVARGMYYEMSPYVASEQRALAQDLRKAVPVYEPAFLERLVALTYLAVGSEVLWIARIYSSAFWVLGAIGLYVLAGQLTSRSGGLTAAAFYLILPYSVIASRSFQPDPLMTALIVLGLLTIWRWTEAPSSRRAIIAGAACGAAVLVKAVAAFPILGAILGATLSARGMKRPWGDPQLWVMLTLSLLPSAAYYLVLTNQGSSGLFSFWVVSLRNLVSEPFFYVRWVQQIEYVIGFGWLIVGLMGALLLPGRVARPMLLGAWGGYLAYGLALPFQIMTHDYYHLMLVPIVGLGLAPLGAAAAARLAADRPIWRIAGVGILFFAAAYSLWEARVTLAAVDYRLEAAGWRRLGKAMPTDGEMVALTHAYGSRLQYYGWLSTGFWPGTADIELSSLAGSGDFNFESEFKLRTRGARYFLITNFAEFDRQPELKKHLYDNYPIYDEGEGYLLFDLGTSAQLEAESSPGG